MSQSYGTIVVIGGGCYGSYYVRQLCRANRADAVTWDRLLVVDRHSDCIVAKAELDTSDLVSPSPLLVNSTWSKFFRDYLGEWNNAELSRESDSIVPSPLMPHLLYEWVRDRAVERQLSVIPF